MSSGSVNFASNNMFPLTHSVLFDRPYLSIIRNHQKKKKPQFSKLSILTKTSIGSTKVASSEFKRNKKQKDSQKQINRKQNNHYMSIKVNTKKNRSNSHDNRTNKTVKQFDISKLGLSCQHEEFEKICKQTPMSRTVCKRNDKNSISPLYSSLIFNSVQQNFSPEAKEKNLKGILDRTFDVLSSYKEECKQLRKQRDFYKKKYYKTSSKLKKLEKYRANSRF